MRSFARAVQLLGWVVALAVAGIGLAVVGDEHLAAPLLSQPATWGSWALEREPVDVVAGIGRLLGIAVVVVLLASTLAQLVVTLRSTRAQGRSAAQRRVPLAPAFVAALVAAVVSSSSHAGAQGAAVPPGSGAVMEVVEDSGAGARTSLPLAPDGSPNAAEPGAPAAPAPPAAPPAGELAPQGSPPTAEDGASAEWLVAPGDHLWGIAERVLIERSDADPTDRDVHRYWVQLIRANTDRLVDPDDPDLILPGQRLALP